MHLAVGAYTGYRLNDVGSVPKKAGPIGPIFAGGRCNRKWGLSGDFNYNNPEPHVLCVPNSLERPSYGATSAHTCTRTRWAGSSWPTRYANSPWPASRPTPCTPTPM